MTAGNGQTDAPVADATAKEDRILEELRPLLANHQYRALRSIELTFHEGLLTLRGTVTLYYLKQLAQEAFRGHPEVTQVVNNIVVK